MIQSMTAFAKAEKTKGATTVQAEIRTYNHRYLDIAVRLASDFLALEERIKALVTETLHRGRVEIRLQIVQQLEEVHEYQVDVGRAKGLHQALQQLSSVLQADSAPLFEIVAGTNGVISPMEKKQDLEALWPLIEVSLRSCLDHVVEMRRTEGDHLAADIARRVTLIEGKLAQIEQGTDLLLDHYRERLQARIAALTSGVAELDPGRIAQEAAFLADRSDISEEIVRAGSHLQQCRKLLSGSDQVGRKFNFLLQELNREFNTMGSKSGKAATAHLIVDVKTEIEKIREQIQNIQ